MIKKGAEPQSLTMHRLTEHSDYKNYADKRDLRQALVVEQRELCCYCMGRIRPHRNSMKIEHWQSQVHYPDNQLDYKNLLGACLGGEGQPVRFQHCDSRKGDRNLKWNPATSSHRIEARVRYESDGSIRVDDEDFDDQLDDVLKNNRKGSLNGFLEWLRYESDRIGNPVPRERFVRERKRLTTGNGPLKPFCQVAVWWLDQRLARVST